MEEIFRNIVNLRKKLQFRHDDFTLEPALKLHLLLLLMEYDKLSDLRSILRKLNPTENQVHDIIRYIDEHYDEAIQLDDLTAQFGKSKYYISHLFREVTRFTFVEYVQYRRVIEAQKSCCKPIGLSSTLVWNAVFKACSIFIEFLRKYPNKHPPLTVRKINNEFR